MVFIKELLVSLFLIQYCYSEVSYEDYKQFFNKQVVSLLDKYESGNYSFHQGTTFKIYKPDRQNAVFDTNAESESVTLSSVEDREGCLGLKNEIGEIIVLDCLDSQPKEPGCFYVFSPSYENGNEVPSDETMIEKACVEVLNEKCVGIITPNDWMLPLDCVEPTTLGISLPLRPSN